MALLVSGNFEEGWREYEHRFENSKLPTFSSKRNFSQPYWLGKESLAGKTIFILSEQGLGDTLQFCRYCMLLSDLGAKVILESPSALINLMKDVPGVTQVIKKDVPPPPFDYYCSLLSLPLAFKTTLETIPAPSQYLAIDKKKRSYWETTLGPKKTPRIGLVWSGSAKHANNDLRSIPLAMMLQHLPKHLQYIALQTEFQERDQTTLANSQQILNFSDQLNDFTDTAALVSTLDLVITVDTSLAHLSGGLSTPTWVLIQSGPDWRWLLGREDSPWYPSIRLYRQDLSERWEPCLSSIGKDLLKRFPD